MVMTYEEAKVILHMAVEVCANFLKEIRLTTTVNKGGEFNILFYGSLVILGGWELLEARS